eukprot:TRINITY_DN111839_c0_g1_i1.p1 TRINITY_DN111839_c0_g1~~TRINITY_DN111839_c0_g1_i1.p1  ORF type:complete len:706 (-),score=123.95 TRINITY_DN111839_c0_g1_i1:193-2310(-)
MSLVALASTFRDGSQLRAQDKWILNELRRFCPKPLSTILRSDPSTAMQLVSMGGGLSIVGGDMFGGSIQCMDEEDDWVEASLTQSQSQSSGGRRQVDADVLKQIGDELTMYFLESSEYVWLWKNRRSATATPNLHAALSRALLRFLQLDDLMRDNGAVLAAWCDLLRCITEEKVFSATKLMGSSKFERSLGACLALLDPLRRQIQDLASSRRCDEDEDTMMNAYVGSFGQGDSVVPYITLNHILLGRPGLGFATSSLSRFSQYSAGYTDTRTFVEDVVADMAGGLAFAAGFVSTDSPLLGAYLNVVVCEAVRGLFVAGGRIVGRSREERSLACAYAMLGLNPQGVHLYTPSRIEQQLRYALYNCGDRHPVMIWTGYLYIKKHQYPELWNPYQADREAIDVLGLEPFQVHSLEVIRSAYNQKSEGLAEDSAESMALAHAYKHLSEKLLEGRYNYDFLNVLGQGTFGRVTAGAELDGGGRVAIKSMTKLFLPRYMWENEARQMKCCEHPNVVKFHSMYEDDRLFYLVLEYCSRGDLMKYIDNTPNIPLEKAFGYTKDTLRGIAHIHSLRVCHRDLKPHNVLISEDGICKLADFGLSVEIPDGRFLRTRRIGTLLFMAPEMFSAEPLYSLPVDVWAMGCILYVLLTGFFYTAENASKTRHHLQKWPEHLQTLCWHMLEQSQHARPSANEALAICDFTSTPACVIDLFT